MKLAALLLPALASAATVGTVSGPVDGDGNEFAYYWRGIPYAAPPVERLRWTPPQPAANWTQPLNAKSFSAACMQKCRSPPITCPTVTSEDCLYLNVYTPSAISSLGTLLPVMIFFHGGDFEFGSGGLRLYDASIFVNRTKTVVVTVNYRLGAFGYLQIPGTGITGNYGFLDQQYAMMWVQNNIRSFGGDATNVTLFGQSAGAMSIGAHLASPSSWGLFHRVIMESNPYGLIFNDGKLDNFLIRSFIRQTACPLSGVENCLRGLPSLGVLNSELVAQMEFNVFQPLSVFVPWTPIVGSSILAEQPLMALRNGRIRPNTPIFAGHVMNETLMFIYVGIKKPVSLFEVRLGLTYLLGPELFLKVQSMYKMSEWNCPNDDCRHALAHLGDHLIMKCPLRYGLNGANRGNTSFAYYFDHMWSYSKKGWGDMFSECWDAACHGEELPFVFGAPLLYSKMFNISDTDAERDLTFEVMKDWGTFAHTGATTFQPFGSQSNEFIWRYAAAGDNGGPSGQLSDVDKRFCDFWDEHGYLHGYGRGGTPPATD